MRISELSAQTGVSTHRLRRYEALGLIRSEREANGYRSYNPKMVKSVIFIDMSRKVGFTLAEIAEYLPRYRAGTLTAGDMIEAMQKKVNEIDEWIAGQRANRKMLTDHISWFRKQARRQK